MENTTTLTVDGEIRHTFTTSHMLHPGEWITFFDVYEKPIRGQVLRRRQSGACRGVYEVTCRLEEPAHIINEDIAYFEREKKEESDARISAAE